MRSTLAIVALVSCSCATLAWAGRKHHPWLSIVKSTDGYLFEGRLERTEFSFDIPGDQIQVGQQEEPGDPATMAIDELFFSVVRVSTSDFAPTGPDTLAAYKEYEQQYERSKNEKRNVINFCFVPDLFRKRTKHKSIFSQRNSQDKKQ